MYDFKMLKLKIKEVYDTQEDFAKALGMSKTSLNLRLNNGVDWKMDEVKNICTLLDIPFNDVPRYFFCPQVQKNVLNHNK